MALFLFAATSGQVVTTAEAKLHCRIDASDDDTLIDTLIDAATQLVETVTHRALLSQTWDLKLEAFPCDGDELWLPKPPVSAVSSITYLDTAGASQTWATTEYLTDLPTGAWARKARITPAYGVVYPSTYPVPNAVTVRFVCGYGAAAAVPAPLKAAIKLLVGHWYQNREAVNVGNITSELPLTVPALLWPFKAF